MKMDIITMEDLQQFKSDMLSEIRGIVGSNKDSQSATWLRSSQVRKMLSISPGTLQTMRINGTLPFRKIGKIMYYSKAEIEKILKGE